MWCIKGEVKGALPHPDLINDLCLECFVREPET